MPIYANYSQLIQKPGGILRKKPWNLEEMVNNSLKIEN